MKWNICRKRSHSGITPDGFRMNRLVDGWRKDLEAFNVSCGTILAIDFQNKKSKHCVLRIYPSVLYWYMYILNIGLIWKEWQNKCIRIIFPCSRLCFRTFKSKAVHVPDPIQSSEICKICNYIINFNIDIIYFSFPVGPRGIQLKLSWSCSFHLNLWQ